MSHYLRFDRLFLGAQGFAVEEGVSDYNLLEVEVKKAAIRQAREVILLADASKWRRVSFVRVAPLSAVSTLITDASFPLEERAALGDLPLEVIYAAKQGG